MRRTSGTNRRGITIIEGLIASAILAVTVTAIIAPFTTAAQCEHEDARMAVASFLAQELLEEIITKPFYDPQGGNDLGPETGENSRGQYDNVDDFHGYSETGGSTAGICDAYGIKSTDPRASNLVRSAQVEYVHLDGQTVFFENPTVARVMVTVKRNGTPIVTLTRLVRAPDDQS